MSERGRVVTGADIKAVRRYLNLTQDEFREALGVTLSTIKGWERQQRIPRRVQYMVRGLLWEMVLKKMFPSG
jgi:DNA-binding transcriptional regulator YiaG